MRQRKVISVILLFCITLSLLPANFNIVWAEEDAESTDMSEMDALSALGIDSSTPPEGFDENDTSNPYGKDTVTINPIDELYVVGLSENTKILEPKKTATTTDSSIVITEEINNQTLKGTIYGHNNFTGKTTQEIISSKTDKTIASGKTVASGQYSYLGGSNVGYYLQTDNYDINSEVSSVTTETFNIAASKTVNGNFDENTEGKSSQNVLVYTEELSEHGGLYMRIGDVVSGEYGSPITLIPKSNSIGNPSDLITDVKENFATDPYLMQNYLQVTSGNYDGKGADEIAVFIPEYGKSRIVVYRLIKTTGQSETAYRNAVQWEVAWTYSLKELGYVSNMVSLVSGDFNEDGVTDLGATWGYYYGPDNNRGSKAVIMFGAEGSNMLKNSQEFDLTYGDSKIVRASFTFGDIAGSGDEVLILGGQSDADIKGGNIYSRYVAIYNWNGSSFVVNTSKNFNLFEKDDDGEYINSAMAYNNDVFYSSSLCPANIAVISQGLSESAYLYLDSLLIKYGDDGLEIEMAIDQAGPNQGNDDYYVEYGVVSGDLVGLGYDTVATMQQTMSSVETIGTYSTTWNWYYKNWLYKLFKKKTWYPIVTADSCTQFLPNDTYMIVMDVKDNYKTKTNVDSTTSICMQNTDNDTSFLQYSGKHYFTYTDPEVLAVLASPPYFSDLLNRDDLSGSYGESTTSYSSTKGSGGGDTFNTTIEVGAYVSVEQEFSVFGVVVASAEAEMAVTAGFTYETENTSSLEQTISYSAAAGEDMIAFFSIPLEIYEYNAYTSNGDGTYTKQTMTVNIPRTAAIQLLTLESYEKIAKDYDALPQISGTVLKHTLGDPTTYNSSSSGFLNALAYDGDWARVGYSSYGASVGQEIAMSNENSTSYNISGRIDSKAGAGAGGVKVGVTFGTEVGGGWVTTTTSGNSFSGELQNMPIEAEEYGYSYSWKIFSYLYDDGKISFPIVDYLVQDIVAPPALPTDFKQNVEKTTDTEIAFSWTYDKLVAGFQIYRYYEFPDGAGSYELSFIPMTDGVYHAYDGLYHFEYIDGDLSPYTDYQYQIQTVRASVPNNSIPSEVISARTKTDVGYPLFNLVGLDEDGYHRIYPDSKTTVSAVINNAEDYPEGISYQWQKFANGVWTDMAGKTSNKLTFESSGVADEAKYRCRTNVIYFDSSRGNNYYISAYTDEFETKYSKRTPVLVDDSFIAITYDNDTGGTGVNINLDLMSGNTNHYIAPKGNVTFTVKGTDYNADYTVALAESSTARPEDDKFTAKAHLDIENLPDGVYEVSAYYSGNRVFQSLTIDENITFLVGDTGYQLILSNDSVQSISYIYGDEITPTLKYFENIDGHTTVSEISTGIDYYLVDSKSSGTETYVGVNEDRSFRTPNVGSYTLKADLNGSGIVADRDFVVSQRDITVKAMDKSDVGKGYVSVNPPELGIIDGTMAFDEALGDLNLLITATNSAGNSIILNDLTEPGNYNIIGGTSDSTDAVKYNNYKVTYVPGVYTIIGQKYLVTIIAEQYQGRDVGTITLSNSDDGLGAEFSASTELLFYATPYSGYEVDAWNVTVTDTGAVIVLDDSQFNTSKTRLSLTMNNEPITVEVSFKKSKITLTTAMEGIGTITCDDPAFVSGGFVMAGADITFTAEPETGYNFKEWRIESGGVTVIKEGITNDDGTNTLTFNMGYANTTLRAVFERESYILTLSDNLEAVYSYEDDLGNPVEKIVYSGANIVGDTEVLVRVKAGFDVEENAIWSANGIFVTPGSEGYLFNILENTVILVDTIQMSYDITTISQNGSISVTINGVSSDELNNIPGGSNVVFTAHPAHGYAFEGFIVTGTDKYTQEGSILRINQLGTDVQVEATFTKSTDYDIRVSYGIRGEVNYILYDAFGNEVETDTVLTGSEIGVCHGDKITLIVTPDAGYMVDKWTIDGVVYDTNIKLYTLNNIISDRDVLIDIISQTSYTVNYGVEGGNGVITNATSDGRSFASGDNDIGGNSKLIITSEPTPGYMVDYWTINGVKVLNEDDADFVSKILTIDSLTSQTVTVDIKVYFELQNDHSITYITENASITEEFTPNDASTMGYVRDGAKAVFTITPDAGYRVVSVGVEGSEYSIVRNEDSPTDDYGTWTVTVNEVSSDLTVNAVAKEIYDITLDEVTGGTLTSDTTTKFATRAIEGELVKIYQDAELDYTFNTWYVSENGGSEVTVVGNINEGFSFIMPDSDVTVSAVFEDIDTVDINYEVYDINDEEDNGYNGTLYAEISREGVSGYPICVAEKTTSGAITSINRGWTDDYVTWPMSTVTFTAKPDTDYKVLKWTIDGVEYNSPLSFPYPTDSINTLVLNVEQNTEDIDIIVQFEQIGDRVTYGVDGGNGSIISATNESTGNEFISGNVISLPSTISFEAEPEDGYEVEAWLVNGIVEQSGVDTSYQYQADGVNGAAITVRFARVPFTVIYDGLNGSVTSDEVESGETVRGDTEVTFEATADPGYKFSSFTVESSTSFNSYDNPLTITITEDTTVTANFVTDANCSVNYSVEGTNGTLTAQKDDAAFNSGDYGAANDVITFTATPDANYKVKAWNIDGDEIESDDTVYNLTVSKAVHNVTVEFERSHYLVDFSVLGGNGTISAEAFNGSIMSGVSLAKGSYIEFEAVPDEGYQVAVWKENDSEIAGSREDLTYKIENLSDDTKVNVAFEVIPEYTISIETLGTGDGTFTAYVNDAETPVINGNITVKNHDKVKLVATPKDEYNKAVWSVTCLSDYEINNNIVVLNNVTADTIATLTFKVAELITVKADAVIANEGDIDVNGSISAKEGYGDILSPINVVDSTVNVTKGKTLEFTATPADGYMVKTWLVNDVVIDSLTNVITMVPETNIHVKVMFEPIVAHKIPKTVLNYSVANVLKAPDELPAPLYDDSIRDRGCVTFTLIPDNGFYFEQLTIFGVDCLTAASSSEGTTENIVSAVKNNDNSYTITIANVTMDIVENSVIVAHMPVVTLLDADFGHITATYSYIDENLETQTVIVNSGDYIPVGTELIVLAEADSGYRFDSWGDYAGSKRGNPIKIIIPNSDITISAEFKVKSTGGVGGGIVVITYDISAIAGKGGRITPKSAEVEAGENQTFLIIPDEGYKIGDVLVNGKSVGAVSSYTFEEVSKDSVIEAKFVQKVSHKFMDVQESDWYKGAVDFVVGNGLFNGTSDSTFSPNNSMTRGMFVTVLGRLYENLGDNNIEGTDDLIFTDIELNQYYSDYVKWASDNGLVNGYSANEFKPNSVITREQIASIMYRYAEFIGIDTSAKADINSFSDSNDVSSWAEDSLRWAVGLGLINGRTDGTLDPQGYISRCEVAAILQRFVESLK